MLANPITLVIAAIALLVAGFVTLYMKNEAFREAVNKLFEGIKTLASNVLTWLKTNWPLVLAILTGPIGLAVLAIAKNWDKIIETIKGFVTNTKKALSGIWNGLTDGLKTAWDNAKAWWNLNVATKKLKIGGATILGKTLPSFTLGFPSLAKGGVVMPSPGGTMAQIAEAGRPERVEPLDAQGLSVRDRAIIAELSGGGKGTTINMVINPSPGMNESELASIVSRQIAFQLRRGGA
jgi:phage-related protein